jgi:hypothetical protein
MAPLSSLRGNRYIIALQRFGQGATRIALIDYAVLSSEPL